MMLKLRRGALVVALSLVTSAGALAAPVAVKVNAPGSPPASTPRAEPTVATREAPSLVLLMLGMAAIGLHGLSRAVRR
jgi:hypothetical protein